MKKKLFIRCLIGAPLGLALSVIITMVISLTVGDGNYYPVVPDMIPVFGNEINAVWVQALLSFLYGGMWAGASVVWEMETWSLTKQTLIHLSLCSLGTLPVAYVCHWMSHSVQGIILYFCIFFGIYLGIWMFQYFSIKGRISQFNEKIDNIKDDDKDRSNKK